MNIGHKSTSNLYIQKDISLGDLPLLSRRTAVGIHGIKGSFTDEAWHRYAAYLKLVSGAYTVVELVHARNVLEAVNLGKIDLGIFAYANSRSGGYMASIEAMGEFEYRLLALFTMPIYMCILSHPKVTSIHDIGVFFGHPVAISQCRTTLTSRWPNIRIEAATDEMDTALSAKLLASGKIPQSHAIFASKRAARIYGLNVLCEGVHDDPLNATSFALVSREGNTKKHIVAQ